MTFTSLRHWLSEIEKRGLLKQVNRRVSLKYELAAVGKKADGRYALRFNNVEKATMPVVTGILGSRELIALAMGVTREKVLDHFARAQANPGQCVLVSADDAPVKEKVTHRVDLGSLPAPIHHEKDGGPYLTAGVLVAKDPVTGVRNVSIHRLQVLGPNRLGILILPRHLFQFFRAAEAAGRPLEVAVAIGLDPLLLLASQALTPPGCDEFTIAGALYGRPLELVKCETVDLEVPARAEIVLEGRLLPGVREMEGPFGEYPKYYGPASPRPVVEVTAMSSCRDPIYHTIIPATMEHLLLGAIPRESGLLQIIRNAVPNVVNVHLTPGGGCRYHVVVSIDKQNEGEAKNAIFAALSSSQEIKHVVVVDKDVDIFNSVDVEWAVATRCQAGRDVFIIERALGNRLDPSSDDGLSDKMGIDATIPLNAESGRFEKIRIPGEDAIKLEDYIE
ncbi:MAG: UbiD family decarboxylase [Bacillota bacterium]